MTAKAHRTVHVALGVLFLALITTGCRTYGGYDTREATAAKIQQATQRSADDLRRAQGERDALARAAAANPALADVAARFAGVVAQQEEMVATHAALAAEAATRTGSNPVSAWVGGDNYRWLHRTYGAVISDQQVIADRYGEVLEDLKQAVGVSAAQGAPLLVVAPHFYTRNRAGQPTVADILSQAQSMNAAAPASQ